MSSKIFRQQLGCRFGSRLSKRGTPTGSRKRIPGSEATAFTGSQVSPWILYWIGMRFCLAEVKLQNHALDVRVYIERGRAEE